MRRINLSRISGGRLFVATAPSSHSQEPSTNPGRFTFYSRRTGAPSGVAPGLLNAVSKVFPKSLRIRCWFHKMANIRSKLPAEGAEEVVAHVRAVRDAPTLEAGEQGAAAVIKRFGDRYPAAMACLADDLEASLAHLRLPVRHRVNVRTTNLLERTFEEERRRSKVIPRFNDEKSAIKLVFATLIRVSDPWNRVSVSGIERQQLRLLRQQLGKSRHPMGGRDRLVDARRLRDSGCGVYRRSRT
jgi:putative transposase